MKLLAIVGIGFLLLFGCIFQQPPSSSVPKDLDIIYRSGACQAEWGQTQTEIFANGTKINKEGTEILTQSELLYLLNQIEKNGFYSLNDYYVDTEVREGSCRFISVTANNKTKTVAVSNMPSPEAFSKTADLINNLTKDQID